MIIMACPWLKETDEGSYCTAKDPKAKLDFDKPPKPGVNGATCRMPAPGLGASEPWSACEWYKPK